MRDTHRRSLLLATLVALGTAAGLLLGSAIAPEISRPVYRNLLVKVRGIEGEPVVRAWIALKREMPTSRTPFLAESGGGPTNAEGDARYKLIPARYHLTVRAEGYAEGAGVVDLRDADGWLSLELEPTVTLAGRLVGPGGRGMRGIRVSIRWDGGARQVRTGPDGSYEASGLPWARGRRWLVDSDRPQGLWRPPSEVRLIPAQGRAQRIAVPPIRLETCAVIEGRLTGPRAAKTKVQVLFTNRWSRDPLVDLPGEAWIERARPGPDGSFEVRSAPPGSIEVYVVLEGAAVRARTLSLAPGETADLGEIPVPSGAGGAVAGRLVFHPGQERTGGVRPLGRKGFERMAEDGSFRIEGILGDGVTLAAGVKYGEHFLMLRERVAVGRTDLVFRPTPARRLRLELIDGRSGKRIENSVVAVAVGDPPVEGSDFYSFRDVIWTRPHPTGTHPVSIRALGFEARRFEAVEIRDDGETRLTVRLTPLP
ncbi:MAG: carboxypeptidase-like regulatory domain-containing protein [Planctomycetota bacterium]